jgi:hypothetical protein
LSPAFNLPHQLGVDRRHAPDDSLGGKHRHQAKHRVAYSIISSAVASSVAGIISPSVFAVFKIDDHLVLGRRLHWQLGMQRSKQPLYSIN